MTTSLEEYVAKATSAYQPSANAIQQQIDALPGRLNETTQSIERDYAQQQSNLNNLSNQAAEVASMQAAGSGGSFGGAANIANRKYYEQSFVPAVTQLQTNRANDIAKARQANEDTRNNLTSQLAGMQTQANTQALNQYFSDTQAQLNRDFNQAQAQLDREWQDYLADKRYKNEAIEAEKVREFQARQAELERQYNAEQAQLNRDFQAQQNAASRALQQKQIDSSNAYNDYIMKAMQGGGAQAQPTQKSSVSYLDWVNNYSNFDDSTKNYLTNNITSISNSGNNLSQNTLALALKNSPSYKQYLNWRNS